MRSEAVLRVRNNRDWLVVSAVSLIAAGIAWRLLSGSGWDRLRFGAVFLALAAVVLSLRPRWIAWAVPALVAAWFAALVGARYVPDVINPAPLVAHAAGDGTLFGTPYEGSQIGAVLSVALPALLALVSLLPVWRRAERSAVGVERSAVGVERPSGSSVWMWIGVAVIAFALVPDLRSYLNGSQLPVVLTSWDVSNLVAWQGFVHMGLVPMKDFFYPYGFQWLYTDGSAGPVYQWLVEIAVLVVAAAALWRLTHGRTIRVLACVLVIGLAGAWAETWRYVPALLIAVTYSAVGPARWPRPLRDYLLLFAACMLAAFVEPDLLGIGLVGALMVLLGEIVAARVVWRSRRFALAVALDALPLLGAALVIVLVWVAVGMTQAELRFLGDPMGVSAEASPNQASGGPVSLAIFHLNSNLLYAAIPALLATAGLLWARLYRPVREDEANVAGILLGAAGVCLMMVLKHFVRSISDEVLSAAMIALAWVSILLWRRDSLVRSAVAAAAVVAIVTMVAESGGMSVGKYFTGLTGAPNRAARSIAVAFNSRERQQGLQAQFDPVRFEPWPEFQIAGDYVATVGGSTLPRFAIVGDAPLVYVLLKQRPPFLSDLDNASPIAEQHAMVDALRREHPAYVIWRRDGSVDATPYYVRDPVVYAWMINNYVPVRRFKSWDILRRRRPGEPIPAAYWRAELGAETNLGYIPSFSTAAASPGCAGGPGCVSYGVVRARVKSAVGVGFEVAGRGQSFDVALDVRPGTETYPVRLDRLWFWPLVGAHATVRSLTPGVTVRVERLRSGDNLY
jgi:hypothetical protein